MSSNGTIQFPVSQNVLNFRSRVTIDVISKVQKVIQIFSFDKVYKIMYRLKSPCKTRTMRRCKYARKSCKFTKNGTRKSYCRTAKNKK